jgi:hypothetical protein
MQVIIQLLQIASIMLGLYTIYAIIMAIYATYIGKTRPIYRGQCIKGTVFLDTAAIGTSFKDNFADFFLPNFIRH